MSITLASISKGQVLRAPRIIVLGVEKIGKTTFSCGSRFDTNGKLVEVGINKPVIIPVKGEEGADSLDVGKFPPCQSYNEIMECIGVLYEDDHEYGTVVLDSASAMEPLVWDAVCQAHNVDSIEKVMDGYGKGYTEATHHWRSVLNGLDALREHKGMASIIIGHVKVKRFDDPTTESFDQYQFDIHSSSANLMFRWADVILFANTKVVVKKEDAGFNKKVKRGKDITNGQRFLFTQKRPAHPGGGRGVYGQLPYELPLDWAAFEAAIAAEQEAGKWRSTSV